VQGHFFRRPMDALPRGGQTPVPHVHRPG
jgi:hypothetical protein